MDYNELIKKANEAKENAYAPYSNFKVGAAVLAGAGKYILDVMLRMFLLVQQIVQKELQFLKQYLRGKRK